MAIPFASPTPKIRVRFEKERDALDGHFAFRNVPQRKANRLLIASWNIANLGVQDRTKGARDVIAHILKQFELIAVQEINEKYRTFEKIVESLGPSYDYLMTDTAGNDERLAFVYDKRKVSPLKLFGELALTRGEYPKRTVRVRYSENRVEKEQKFTNLKFVPFDRNPAIGTFKSGTIGFTLVNCHLYFGAFGRSSNPTNRKKYARRVLEIFALTKWADRRVNRTATYDRDIILTGDMNVPAMTEEDPAYNALTAFGFLPLDYNVSKVGGSNLGNNKTYDQMVFAPGSISRRIKDQGIFDFDNAIFKSKWAQLERTLSRSKAISTFARHVKYHISDHRPLWAELDIG